MIHRPVVCRTFVARAAELAFLNERRLMAARSTGGIVLVAGDAGVGKSRLLREFCDTLVTSRWKIGCGASQEYAQRPYGPVLDILDACEGPTARPLLPASTKREQFDAIAERLAKIATKSAVIGIVEDIHWADMGTLELLVFLAGKLERQRVLFVASFRPYEFDLAHPTYEAIDKITRAAHSARIDLGPLDDAALRAFIDEALANHRLSPETRRLVARTSEGNPFFTEELLRVAVERDFAGVRPHAPALLPSSIRATLLEHYHRLDETDRAILAQAAVIGATFKLSLLAKTLGREPGTLLPSLARARDHQLIEEVDAVDFRFRHALTRRAIYERFLGAQTQALHRTIAATLERDDDPSLALNDLAYHSWAARDHDRSAAYNTRAGDAAAAVHAHEDAIVLYERALESASLAAPARARIVEKIADRYLALGLPERRHATYMQAARLYAEAGDSDLEAQCAVLGVIAAYTAGNAGAIETLHAMLERRPPGSAIARARVHLGIAWLLASSSFPDEALAHLANVDAETLVVNDIALRYHNVAAWVAMTFGDIATFEREFAAWLDAARASDRVGAVASARFNGAACFAALGLHERAISECLASIELARRERNALAAEGAFANLAIAYYDVGNLDGARAALAEISPTPESAVTIANAAAIGTLVGAHLDDEALIDVWFERAGAAVATYPDSDTGAGYAEILVRRGRPMEARMALRAAVPDCVRIRGNLRTLVAIARFGATEDFARARTLLATAADSQSDVPEKAALALFDACVANRAGDAERGRAHAREAAEGFRRLRYPLLEAAACEEAHDVALARELYVRCGAVGSARRLTSTHERGEAVSDADLAAEDGDGLSPRQREIASLVSRGKSNREIAQLLGISHKTVEKHLSFVYQKLGTSSRVALATHLAMRGGG